ncbi:MAG: DUF1573 domain-containing protein [Muribaculaceae bacterium]|nr:DUF1573 domain-containing protein [Muribaculaceae bacterium]MDE6526168.1 DUF1573 domain-containing protein [Muribaculaceae bacterium]
MKTIYRIMIALCLLAAGTASVWGERRVPGDKVGVVFDSLVFDFGTIHESDKAPAHDFTFTVTGSQPVAILYATPSCGCTASDFPRKPSSPGDKAAIKVSFNPKGQRGEVDKDVRVRFKNGAGKSEQLTLRIKGCVIPDKK